MTGNGPFALLGTRRFRPFFLTQFAGAFNDNLFKNALIVYATFVLGGGNSLVNLAAGLFILPFFLFSATAGQIAERHEKSMLIRRIKAAEIAIMALGAVALVTGSLWALLAILFLMGSQSALFGPVKYAILPQALRERELVAGNGLVEMGTFVAILLGTLVGGLLVAQPGGRALTGFGVVAVAVLGWWASRGIPEAPATSPDLRPNWNPVTETVRIIGHARRTRSVFLSILGLSWFWALGAAYLAQFPTYVRDVLGGDEQVATVLLATFSIGVGVGSLLCERLSGGRIELGLVPLGSIGITLFGVDLYFAAPDAWAGGALRDAAGFLADPTGLRVVTNLALIGLCGGFYAVPLFALIQSRTAPEYRSRVIAANNILNAAFMVGSALAAAALLDGLGLTIPQLFLVLAGVNALVAAYIYTLVPEFLMRFLVWMLTSVAYRIRRSGLERIPDEGAVLLVCNHVSYVDALVIAGSCRRPVRFVMDHRIFRTPVLSFIFRTAGAIPIASRREDPEIYERAFARIAECLRAGEVVCIFPEGRLTRDGAIDTFRPGVQRILAETPVPVIPMALRGLWGSFFSHAGGKAMAKLPRRFWSRVELIVGEALPPESAAPAALHAAIAGLRGDAR